MAKCMTIAELTALFDLLLTRPSWRTNPDFAWLLSSDKRSSLVKHKSNKDSISVENRDSGFWDLEKAEPQVACDVTEAPSTGTPTFTPVIYHTSSHPDAGSDTTTNAEAIPNTIPLTRKDEKRAEDEWYITQEMLEVQAVLEAQLAEHWLALGMESPPVPGKWIERSLP
ncbi:hypothetical protein NEOLEDRAFT_797291 [Neolentinus lepideus HHB14362 ss-1]|uniref:Uncharacterized protein n=1 Tax=Neolentinus lepideus HHB14362 ss-1 TaxID=1314782 RepID=A0A165PLJ1_9AGAM|nr:hypothetical protein NEOLEDRAFT_797291 [Neolentinus lepideus HHB14362 ss-1]